MNKKSLATLRKTFLGTYPAFKSFPESGEAYRRAEDDYKRQAAKRLRELLSPLVTGAEPIPASGKACEQLVLRAMALVNFFGQWGATNLKKAISNDKDWRELLDKTIELVRGVERGKWKRPFESLVEWMAGAGIRPAESKVYVTYFPFMWDPANHWEIKPTKLDEFLKTLGEEPLGHGEYLTLDGYERVLTVIGQVRSELSDWDPRDNIDIHNFFWTVMTSKGDRESTGAGHADGQPKKAARIWIIGSEKGSLLDRYLDEGAVRIGWSDIGDLRKLKTRDKIEKALDRSVYNKTGIDSLCLWQFLTEVEERDIIVVKSTRDEVDAVGVVRSDYQFSDDDEEAWPHYREVVWKHTEPIALFPGEKLLPVKTLTELKDRPDLEKEIRRRAGQPLGLNAAPDKKAPYAMADALAEAFVPEGELRAMLGSLRTKLNIVLQGAPGVGKTFLAKRLAYLLLGEKDPARVEMVQFHQSYAYEDFVQGWRPNESGGFELSNAVFHRFCGRARRDADRPHVFIIDEINRGNLSKVLGELMMLIESDKRGPEFGIPLTYSPKRRFSVPANVHLIGLMNTADRSLAMIDYALRRRFQFWTLLPRFGEGSFRERLRDSGASTGLVERIVTRMQRLNEQISADTKNLGRGFQIGHSYFCPTGAEKLDDEWFRSIVEHEIRPLLEEYWFDTPETAAEHVGELLA